MVDLGRKSGETTVPFRDQAEVLLSPCCQPIRGDEVLGLRLPTEQGEILLVHRVRCEHMLKELQKRPASRNIVNMRWLMEPTTAGELPCATPAQDEVAASKPATTGTETGKPLRPARS